MFEAFRALGRIVEDVPFTILHSATKPLIVVSVGHSWQAYDAENLRLVLIGPKVTLPSKPHSQLETPLFKQFSRRITALACAGNLTFAAVKNGIEICRRVNKIGFIDVGSKRVLQMIRMGDLLILLLSQDSLFLWDIAHPDAQPVMVELETGFGASCFVHPATYVNKILIGSESGALQLWNFQKRVKLYTFPGWSSAVTSLETAPALDVVAVGLANGAVVLLNVKFNGVVHRFENTKLQKALSSGASALAFSSGLSVPLIASGGMNGEIFIWNLKEKQLLTLKHDAHSAKVVSLYFYPSSAVLLSAAEDNSLKQWTLDLDSRDLRVLRQRCGPRNPPFYLSFYDTGYKLLTCDKQGALWCLSTIQDQQNRELSTKKRAPLATATKSHSTPARPLALATCSVRERDWGHVLSAHQGQRSPCAWSLHRYSIEKTLFHPPRLSSAAKPLLQPTAVALSQCGNFGLVGYSCGSFHRFNMQSALHRGEYRRSNGSAHDSRVVGCAADSLNRQVVSVGWDGWLRIWEFKTGKLSYEYGLGSAVHALSLHRGNGLCAVGVDDLCIQIFDCAAQRRVRHFRGHTDRLTCLQISSDGRWLLSASMDCSLRIYDIPSANLLHVLSFKHPVVSFSLDPSMELLATAHVNCSGVSLWTNQWIFGSTKPSPVGLPSVEVSSGRAPSGRQLVTLAMMSMSSRSLAAGSTLKEQRQALKPEKPIPEAPFFLPPQIGAGSQRPQLQATTEASEPPAKKQKTEIGPPSEFMSHLKVYQEGRDRTEFSSFLKRQSAVYIEQELLSISRDASAEPTDEDTPLLCSFLEYLEALMKAKEDLEFCQVLLRVALQSNMTWIIASSVLLERVRRLHRELQKCWEPVQCLMDATQCMISLFSGMHY